MSPSDQMVRQAVRQAHGSEQRRWTHHLSLVEGHITIIKVLGVRCQSHGPQVQRSEVNRRQKRDARRQTIKIEIGNLTRIHFLYFEYRILNKEFRMMKFYFPSISNIRYSVFCGSLFSDI